ncbi:MAG: cyclic nucleotide-binding domain-containing protein, partial [Polyangiales bacterium]
MGFRRQEGSVFGRSNKKNGVKAQLAAALKTGRLHEALDLYEQIEKAARDEPRWPHRRGDLLQRMGRKGDAVLAYQRAVDLYSAQGFVARAAAMAKLIVAIDPGQADAIERVDPSTARRLHREQRAVIVTADPTPPPDYDGPPTDTQSLITDAVPLIRDRKAPRGETRFTKPEKTTDVTIDVRDVELIEEPPSRMPLQSRRPSVTRLVQLPSMTLFAEVPRSILRALVSESALVDIEDGQRVTTAGTVADALYVIVEGNAVGRRGADHQSLLLAEGDVAGVACLLADVSYVEEVTACGRLRALRIGKALLDRLVEEHPPFGDVLFEILCRRLIATLVRTNPLFTAFDEPTRRGLARLFEVRRAACGMRILEAGKRSDGMYLPLHGRLVARAANGRRFGNVELGRAIGQGSLLTREPSRYTVEAASDVLLLR